ncbi:MAG TPA: nuclear transport factor 2 family protein [Gemmatimonadaceae bacterium]|nr:nuclear transport factor 2 family protein [Gemmatimonadaceae bacterium]
MAVADCPDAEKMKLEQLDRAWGAATEKGDRQFLTALYADDYEDVGLAGRMGKTAAVAAAMRTSEQVRANPNPPKQIYDHYIISCTPVSALVTHRSTTIGASGQPQYFRSVHALEKRGGNWVVVSNAGHALTPAGEVLYMEHDWSDADRKRDVAWFERNLGDDYSGISSRTGALSTKQQEIADLRSSKRTVDSAKASDLVVRVEGNTAVVTGVYHTTGKDEQAKAYDRKTRFTDVYVKRDGRWQVLTSQGTLITQ